MDWPGSESLARTNAMMSGEGLLTALSAQSFAQPMRNTLRESSRMLSRMQKSLVQIVAQNVKAAAKHHGHALDDKGYRSLGRAAGVAANTVKNVIEPETRAPTASGKEPSPQLNVLDKIAKSMGYEAWQLLLDNFDPAQPFTRALTPEEAKFYNTIDEAYRNRPRDE